MHFAQKPERIAMRLQSVGQLFGQAPVEARKPAPLGYDEILRRLQLAAVRLQAGPPPAPEVGNVYRAHNGSLMFVFRKDSDGDFIAMCLAGGARHLTPGNDVCYQPDGFPIGLQITGLGLVLAEKVGTPGDLIGMPGDMLSMPGNRPGAVADDDTPAGGTCAKGAG
jgi:hypothetical protein